MTGQLSGQVSSSAVIAVARTRTSSSPGPGSGTGMLSLVRLAGSEFDARMARIERTASFMDRVLPVLRDRCSDQPDLFGRVHAMLLFECHGAHGFPPVGAIRPRYGRIGLRPRANQFRISWANRH